MSNLSPLRKGLPIALFAGVLCGTADAQSDSAPVRYQVEHPYVGVRAGWAAFEDACAPHASSCNNDTVGAGVFAGYQLNEWLAIEGGYTYLGSPDAYYGSNAVEADVDMLDLSGVLRYEFSPDWSIYGRVGAAYEMIDKSSTWAEDRSANEWGVQVGAGIEYALSPQWSVRTELQYNDGIGNGDVEQADLYFTSIGLAYHFKDALPVEPTPAPVPPPAPPPTPVMRHLNLNASALFATDSAQLTPSTELQLVASKIRLEGVGAVFVTGHTDSRGSDAYNQRLSERRAQAVADYLQQQGVERGRLQAQGRGEAEPVASNDTAQGRAQNRRVELAYEVVITESEQVIK